VPKPDEAGAWLTQARADLKAATTIAPTIAECHRRYWLQQTVEKALKAYAISLLPDDLSQRENEALTALLLRHHAPLSEMATWSKDEIVAKWGIRAYKRLRFLKTYLNDLVANDAAGSSIRQVDDTKPSLSSKEVSYRYPFFRQDRLVAPVEWQEWAGYQGDETKLCRDIEAFIGTVGKQLGKSRGSRLA
jgi:HEPN domain-containing protein